MSYRFQNKTIRYYFIILIILTVKIFSFNNSMFMGTRSISLGKAYVSISDDAEGCYWNPAGLNFIGSDNTIYFRYLRPYNMSVLQSGIFSYIKKTNNTIFGIMWNYDFILLKKTISGNLNYKKNLLIFSAAKRVITDKINLGANFKLLNIYSDISGTSWSSDFGVVYEADKKFKLGLVLKDFLSPKINYYKGTNYFYEKIVPTIVIGGSIIVNKVILTSDVSMSSGEVTEYRSGVEITLLDFSKLQLGIFRNTNTNITGGVSIDIKKMNIQYSVVYNNLLGLSNMVGLSYRF